jgi:rare lipoprotein A
VLAACAFLGAASPIGAEGRSAAPEEVEELSGYASWYGGKFHGRRTASGEVFNTNELTAAHRTLPFNSIVRVTNAENGKSVIVRINDRGPFVDGRVIDLSRAAADVIGITAVGVAPVELEVLHLQKSTELRTIQVASFSEEPNAVALARRLQDNDIPAVIERPGGGIHRVIIQGVAEDRIPQFETRLAALGYENILIREK